MKLEYSDISEQFQLKRDQCVLLETRLNDAEHKLASRSNRSSEISSQANVDQADARHKAVKQVRYSLLYYSYTL